MALSKVTEQKRISSVNGTDDREAHNKFWIAACTRPKSEIKASFGIECSGIETYVPIQTVTRQWSDRKKEIKEVVIPNIIFVHLLESDIRIVRQNSLVTRILTLPGQKSPAHIPHEQIDTLKFMLKESDLPVRFRPLDFSIKDKVRIVRGNLKGLVGSVERISGDKSVLTVVIDLLGSAVCEIPDCDLETINN